ncbi:hypothetical protein [Anaplasma phagocytophilum]|nr:hypothetical protein [Anaplasma phagocytophilum]
MKRLFKYAWVRVSKQSGDLCSAILNCVNDSLPYDLRYCCGILLPS